MRIMMSAGGTGGGVYPALAVAGALRKLYPDVTLTFVGARGDMARDLVHRSDVTFDGYYEVLAGPLHGIPRARQVVSLFKIVIGVIHSLILAIRLRPEALFLTGGWVGFPMAAACWLLRRPIVIYVPDIEPGLTLKILGRRFASTIAATAAETGTFYPGKTVVETGYPLRDEIVQASREAGIKALNLDPSRKTLLVFGGSKGSRSINTVMGQIGPDLLAEGLQIVHISGRLDFAQVEAQYTRLTDEQKKVYQVFAFIPDIGQAFAAADLVISRAGAATLAEYPQLGLPAILVPYPHTWRYQEVNADFLVAQGGAVRVDDERLADDLLPAIRALMGDPARLDAMRSAMSALRFPDGAANIARVLAQTAGHPAGNPDA
ncbi:MAG: UDP-N-acetylglucosamine--N-acetylmuramyl-(pentapeptide) pyrophosphoryl-undecaprenol N-acetylglucosamine transferase [Anaerolineae bacterium]|nr:UDP-N-acetylglucosamine--N-acetylmuramyl-(pentapeptide) pyrophosphoryl-undecaprenol N-acetylglucosamine transferase [Anaerolineae bacterium]